MGRGTEQNAVLLEVGDVLWYTVSLSLEVGSTLAMPEIWPERPIQARLERLAALQRNEADGPEILMMACAAQLSGRVKKSLRRDKSLQDFAPAMREHRNELLSLCAEVAAMHGATLQQCALLNVQKLRGRFHRGSVRGDGDTR